MGNAGSELFDHTRKVESEDGGKRLPGMGGVPASDLDVQRVDPARANADKQLTCLRNGAIHFRVEKRTARTFKQQCAHASAVRHGCYRPSERRKCVRLSPGVCRTASEMS